MVNLSFLIKEAHILGIPVVGIVDTNCDPDQVDYVIPGNDDAIRAVALIAGVIADAVIEANQGEQLAPVAVEEASAESMAELVETLETPVEEKKPARKPRAKKVAEPVEAPTEA